MSADRTPPDPVVEDQVADLLIRYDEAMRGGNTLSNAPSLADSNQSPYELEHAVKCLRLLEEVFPRQKEPTRAGAKLVTLGRFDVVRELGRGGFGVVYLAVDPLLGREVALKVPHAERMVNPEVRSRFQREARAVAGLDHPHIVPIFETGESGSSAYIALAYCPCITLGDWLRQQREPVPITDAAVLVRTLAEAVQYAHERGIIHRDLKPANVLLTVTSGAAPSKEGVDDTSIHASRPLGEFIAKLTDFGLAKEIDASTADTRSGAIVGTPNYMAPEQAGAKGWPMSPAADLYSLGAILYELLTGRPPFVGESVLDTLHQVCFRDPIPPRRLRQSLPRDLETICLKCLEKDPRKRYASAQALAEDLRCFLDGRPILARPIGPLGRMLKWSRRNPATAALSAITAAIAVVSAAVLVITGIEIQQKKQDAENAKLAAETALQSEITARTALSDSLDRERQTLYYQRIRLALASIQQGNIRQAESYLEECKPNPGDRDLRGWEWDYLDHLCHSELRVFLEHAKTVYEVALSPDGKTVASLSAEALLIWEAATGRVLFRLPGVETKSHKRRLLCFSPNGKYLAYGEETANKLTVWSIESGREVHTLRGCLPTFRPDGRWLAAIDVPAKLICIYDVQSGFRLHQYRLGDASVRDCVFCSDVLWLAADGPNRTVAIRRADIGMESCKISFDGMLVLAMFSPDGQSLATSTLQGAADLWDASTGEHLFATDPLATNVQALAFSPDSRLLATGNLLGTIKIWDRRGRVIQSLPGHSVHVTSLAFSPAGPIFASSGSDRQVKLWAADKNPEALVFHGHDTFVRGVAFDRSGDRGVSTGQDGTICVWDADNGRVVFRTEESTSLSGPAIFSTDGSRVLAANVGTCLRNWDAQTGREFYAAKSRTPRLRPSTVSPCGKWVATPAMDFSVMICDSQTDSVRSILRGHKGYSQDIAFSPDGTRIATATSDQFVRIWDVETGRELVAIHGESSLPQHIAFSSDGRRLAMGGESSIRVCDSSTGELIVNPKHPWGRSQVFALAFSPDGKRLASGGFDRSVVIWDLDTGLEVISLPTHRAVVTDLQFSPNGHRLAAVINDGSIVVWDATPRTKKDEGEKGRRGE
jgi:WD40 repeat protein/serine/threonine protein kinase